MWVDLDDEILELILNQISHNGCARFLKNPDPRTHWALFLSCDVGFEYISIIRFFPFSKKIIWQSLPFDKCLGHTKGHT